jgi:uncharacterized protein
MSFLLTPAGGICVTTEEKVSLLEEMLGRLGSVAVAFSGGVDSAFLAAAAKRALGGRVVLVTARSATSSAEELNDASAIADALGIRHIWLDSAELSEPAFTANDRERCYYCKKSRFAALVAWAKDNGIAWVAEGTNADDTGDYRPGMKAVAELPTVVSPLLDAGLTKDEIRTVSRHWGLPTWDKPSAACLVSRLAYGLPVTEERLRQVEAAELAVRRLVAGQVRVRHHGDLARIEVAPAAFGVLASPDNAAVITAAIRALGFTFVALDLAGYRTGSMNETLKLDEV